MKKFLFILAIFFVVSCQKQLIERRQEGCLTFSLNNSPVVELTTRAESSDVDVDLFLVHVKGDEDSYDYVYGDMPSTVIVPVGFYAVSAENVTEAASYTEPDEWGQVRYAGTTDRREVLPGMTPTVFSLTCTMANTAVSVEFDGNLDKHFTDYTVTLYNDSARKLVYTPENTSAESAAVGYFDPVPALVYEFAAIRKEDSMPFSVTGTKDLSPASHLFLKFNLSMQNGYVGKPAINVDASYENLYETITIDPIEGEIVE